MFLVIETNILIFNIDDTDFLKESKGILSKSAIAFSDIIHWLQTL